MKTSTNLSKSLRTRQFIIEKSAVLFNKKGISGTSLSDIIAATGLTKGSIYGNFKDKEDVALAVFEYNVHNLLFDLHESIKEINNPLDKLLEYPKYFRKECERLLDNGGCAILNTAIEVDDTHQPLREVVKRTIKSWEKSLVKIIEAGIESKEIKKGTDPYTYASLFIATFEGGVMLSKVTGEKKYIYHALDHWEGMVIKVLKN